MNVLKRNCGRQNYSAVYGSGKMGTLSLRIPDSYHTVLKEISSKENISINQFINVAIAEKISAFQTVDYLEQRAKRGSKDKFFAVLAKVPSVPPRPDDL